MKKGKTAVKYDFARIEKKWQKVWQDQKLFEVDMEKAEKPFYNLMMFPYPSAEGLHVGGVYTYTGVDTFGRFKRMQGYDVFEPIGLDGFGIHSENYAMKIREHIEEVSKRTEKNFYRQLSSIGNMFDWSRTVETYKPEYYRWTQWIFLQMFKKGLAYQKKAKVNWCPSCKTVLSDEQVIQGQCERCESFVDKRELKQWFFRITKYADRLLKNLDWIDWPEDVKTNQRNWIGRSEGANIKFKVEVSDKEIGELGVFTTRPDTLFGATYMVLAPEHELVKKAKSGITNWKEVEKYISKAISKSEQERKNDEKIKTGVELKGVFAVNPASGNKISIWVADYVLAGYGMGAIMAVPAHDTRDWEFAKKFNIKIESVVAPYLFDTKYPTREDKETKKRDVVVAIVRNKDKKEYLCLRWNKIGWQSFITGGIDGEDIVNAAKREVLEESGYVDLKFVKELTGPIFAEFFRPHKDSNVIAKFRYLVFDLVSDKRVEVDQKEKDQHEAIWVSEDKIEKFLNVGNQKMAWDCLQSGEKVFTEKGTVINSGFLNGLKTDEAKAKMIDWLEEKNIGKRSIDFKLRDWCVSRQRYWGPPIPIVWCKECAKRQKKRKVLMVHGFEDAGDGNWFSWLKKEFEKHDCEVFTPTLKTNKKPNLEQWMEQLKPYIEKLDENSIVIGHSLGSKAALHLLERNNKKVDKVFLVASAIGNLKRDWKWLANRWKDSDVDSLKKFWETELVWDKINSKIGQAFAIVSEDDWYVDSENYKNIKLEDLRVELWDGHRHFQQVENVQLRDFIFENVFPDGDEVPIPVADDKLPVELPHMDDFLPEGTGKGPLARNKEFVKTTCPICGADAERETDVSDPFVDSSWYFFRYPSTEFGDVVFDKERTKKWLPVDSYIGGKEHTVLHLLYSRFVTMVLNDLGYTEFEEPYKRFFGHGLITKEGAKMSKSKGNVVNPDDMIGKYGADTTRMYLRFLGDFSQGGDWRDSGVEGMNRFIKKLWNLFFELEGNGVGVGNLSMIDKTIKAVGEDLEKLSFNTAVARLMEFTNWIKENKEVFNKDEVYRVKETMALVFAPMTPHLAEEFWQDIGGEGSVSIQKWPKYDKDKIVDDEIEIVVQVNGKLRDKIKVPKDISEEDAKKLAKESVNVRKFTKEKEIKRIIYVPGKLVSIVV